MRLIIEKNGKLYGNRPASLSPCPICGRSQIVKGRDSRGAGFRMVGWQNHVHACYEKALAKLGFYEKEYDSRVDKFLLGDIKNKPEPMKYY